MYQRRTITCYRHLAVPATLTLIVLTLASGCVSSGKYEALQQEKNALETRAQQLEQDKESALQTNVRLEADKAALESEKAALLQQTQQTEEEKARMAAAVEAARTESARQQATFDNLRTQFSAEMQSNQVKIELLKSGINVNLSQEVLFRSGSSRLNKSGEAIIRKIVPDLNQGNYQIIVAGFTDNVAISESLAERYPSNWELAGARAASVVRLLEEEGVPAERMVATSYGENRPVANNDTADGRAQNRRIEISLRPVEVESAQP